MRTNIHTGADAEQDGGADLVISLSGAEATALGMEAATLADWFASALAAVVAMRTGHVAGDPANGAPTVADTWYWVINDVDNRLLPRIEGIRDAAIRAHIAAGGSLDRLALAMDAPKSSAQRPWNRARTTEPTLWERWATGTLPEPQRAELPDAPAVDQSDGDDPVVATVPPMPVHAVTYRDRATGRRVEAMRTGSFDAAAAELARLRREGAPLATMYIDGR